MTFLTGKGIIDDALSVAPGGGVAVRAKMVLWLNVIAQKLAVVRPWLFLSDSAQITPVDGVIILPNDYGQFGSVTGGRSLFMDCRNRLTDGEAAVGKRGFVEGMNTITLKNAGYSGPVTLAYTIEPPPLADTAAATVWPMQCKPLFMRSLLDYYYEFDFDERQATSYQLNELELSELKKWDNSRKPRGQRDRRGLRASR